jgi:hypothetical protein
MIKSLFLQGDNVTTEINFNKILISAYFGIFFITYLCIRIFFRKQNLLYDSFKRKTNDNKH